MESLEMDVLALAAQKAAESPVEEAYSLASDLANYLFQVSPQDRAEILEYFRQALENEQQAEANSRRAA